MSEVPLYDTAGVNTQGSPLNVRVILKWEQWIFCCYIISN